MSPSASQCIIENSMSQQAVLFSDIPTHVTTTSWFSAFLPIILLHRLNPTSTISIPLHSLLRLPVGPQSFLCQFSVSSLIFSIFQKRKLDNGRECIKDFLDGNVMSCSYCIEWKEELAGFGDIHNTTMHEMY